MSDVMLDAEAEAAHVENVKEKTRQLAGALTSATEAGVSQAILLPELMTVFRESGMLPG